MTLKTNLFIAILTFLGCFLLLALRPVPASALKNAKSITGKVVKVSKDVHSDRILIRLNNDGLTYSIYHETDHGFDFENFRNNLLYRKATLEFAGHRTTSEMPTQKIPIVRVSVSGRTFWKQPLASLVVK